ncbi:hypothetical protein GCM10007973_18590 [Polymorphobacter multimanifer]|uniref:Putative RNA-binding Zn-ribbon protein involved in translation (DUF1610 family) n=1 Tax=Polymorphobacter multimanifer TaxID=1070431 RepID=A0A841L331_9SPHN|nr:zinc ribbon domain-containing protein [Polymorphobacter multimanifer]MBB6226706.1 putative RNA-binding Zn-ribbon protein involved in translation (DUF1610 family) [Polymorphobacter multimanifer]GGI82471.1 hypothetical protein GCM10007973_18590 [Polymorphobacter multimanifer]
MARSLRLSESWFNRGLWVLALVFAGFLIGLGGTIVGDLPQVESRITQESFVDQRAIAPLRTQRDAAGQALAQAQAALDQASLAADSSAKVYASARNNFEAWVATRTATERPDQDNELLARTAQLDELKADMDRTQAAVDRQLKARLDAQQAADRAEAAMAPLLAAADARYETARRAAELRVFLYRLALTLPLLAIAGWLFRHKRGSQYWPFVWGFILFALFAFFVELVPYLPSYGGYVRYAVGILLTLLVGRWAITAASAYLARQKLAEAQPETQRRQELTYDTALIRLAKSACPACERPVEVKNTEVDFCPHCGIGLFDRCTNCGTRKNAFAPFCHACGSKA